LGGAEASGKPAQGKKERQHQRKAEPNPTNPTGPTHHYKQDDWQRSPLDGRTPLGRADGWAAQAEMPGRRLAAKLRAKRLARGVSGLVVYCIGVITAYSVRGCEMFHTRTTLTTPTPTQTPFS